jgi:hypothetical protein
MLLGTFFLKIAKWRIFAQKKIIKEEKKTEIPTIAFLF